MFKWVSFFIFVFLNTATAATVTAPGSMPYTGCENLLVAQYPELIEAGVPRQSTANVDALYLQAQSVMPGFVNFVRSIARSTGAEADFVALKAKDRLVEKADARKEGDPSRVLDVARAALVAENMSDVYSIVTVIEALAPMHGIEMIRVKDRFANPKDTGYRDLHINLRLPYALPNGARGTHIVELQIHLKPLYLLKKTHGDNLYREIRKLEGQDTEDAAGKVQKLRKLHKELFDNVFNELQFKSKAS